MKCLIGPKQTISHYHETLGEALQGTELEFSGLEIEFKGTLNIQDTIIKHNDGRNHQECFT